MLLSFSRILWGLLWKVFWLTNCGFKCHSIKTHYEPKRKHRPKLLAIQCIYEWIIIKRLFYAFTFVNISIIDVFPGTFLQLLLFNSTNDDYFMFIFSCQVLYVQNVWRVLILGYVLRALLSQSIIVVAVVVRLKKLPSFFPASHEQDWRPFSPTLPAKAKFSAMLSSTQQCSAIAQ